jgi:putative Holliday junction resolvase
LLDERLTTVAASKALHAAGKTAKQQREIIDSLAAVLILQLALEQESRTARPIGEPIE